MGTQKTGENLKNLLDGVQETRFLQKQFRQAALLPPCEKTNDHLAM